jgi:hypothetical protein
VVSPPEGPGTCGQNHTPRGRCLTETEGTSQTYKRVPRRSRGDHRPPEESKNIILIRHSRLRAELTRNHRLLRLQRLLRGGGTCIRKPVVSRSNTPRLWMFQTGACD